MLVAITFEEDYIVSLLFNHRLTQLSFCFFWRQKSKELGMCENDFKYGMEKRDIRYNKFAQEVRKSMNWVFSWDSSQVPCSSDGVMVVTLTEPTSQRQSCYSDKIESLLCNYIWSFVSYHVFRRRTLQHWKRVGCNLVQRTQQLSSAQHLSQRQ